MIDWDKMVLAPTVGVFGEEVIYMPAEGEAYPITGVYDEGNRDLHLGGGTGFNSSNPIVGVRVAEMKAYPLQGDLLRITRTGDLFEVKDINDDGKGGLTLSLNEAEVSDD
ncbi:head-tail joining protein [Pseudoduganella sp. RAF53_2]|uniref:head-tail joining protein n=1 Tax=unclassified Pseudoduganella TaxID=2637179 RepID=UPI003F99B376